MIRLPDPYSKLKGILPYLVDEEHGIIRQISELIPQPDMPKVFFYKAILSNAGINGPKGSFPVSGGTSLNRDRALTKAVGEAVERYCSGIYFPDQIHYSEFNKIKAQSVPIQELKYFQNGQSAVKGFPLTKLSASTRIGWTKVTRFITGDEKLFPAALVFCPYYINRKENEEAVFENISTGLAAHMTKVNATVNGLLEVIERDFFISTWLLGISHPVLDSSSLTEEHLELISRFDKAGYGVNLVVNIHSSGIPGVIAVMKGRNKSRVPIMVAAATHSNPANAVTKCLEELALIERFAKRKLIGKADVFSRMGKRNVSGLIDHVDYWLNPGMQSKMDFLCSSSEKIQLNQLSANWPENQTLFLDQLIDRIEKKGYTVYVSDLTQADAKSLGMHAVRVVVPGYLPLNKSYMCRPLNSPRLKKVSFGFPIKKMSSINDEPHPFA